MEMFFEFIFTEDVQRKEKKNDWLSVRRECRTKLKIESEIKRANERGIH